MDKWINWWLLEVLGIYMYLRNQHHFYLIYLFIYCRIWQNDIRLNHFGTIIGHLGKIPRDFQNSHVSLFVQWNSHGRKIRMSEVLFCGIGVKSNGIFKNFHVSLFLQWDNVSIPKKRTSRQRSGKGATRKRFPLQKPRWEKTKLTIKYLYHENIS